MCVCGVAFSWCQLPTARTVPTVLAGAHYLLEKQVLTILHYLLLLRSDYDAKKVKEAKQLR